MPTTFKNTLIHSKSILIMKKYLYAILFVIIVLAVFSVVFLPGLLCELRGGKWGRIGIALQSECNLPTSDAGKECTDVTQCEGTCFGENINFTVGRCTEWKRTVGCIEELHNGRVLVRCVD